MFSSSQRDFGVCSIAIDQHITQSVATMAMADHEMLIRGDMSFADDQKRDDPPIQVNIPEDFEIDQYIAQYTGS